MICCYNTKNNNPYKEHHHPRYTPLIKVPDNEVMDYTNKTTNSDEHFLRKDNVDQDWAKNKTANDVVSKTHMTKVTLADILTFLTFLSCISEGKEFAAKLSGNGCTCLQYENKAMK